MNPSSHFTKLPIGTPLPSLPTGLHAPQSACIGSKKDNIRSKSGPRYALPKGYSQELYQPTPSNDKSGKVLALVASCVEANNSLAIFEEVAGRSAMVGFAVAVCAEVALPSSGLFGAWGSDSYNTLLGSAAALLAGAVILAASSKKQSGSLRFQEAVLASLTALSRSASSITQRNVDSAVDYVLEQVFSSSVLDTYDFDLLDIDDFV